MKNLLLPILAIAALPLIPTDAAAQFYVVADDGSVLYRMESGTPAYVTFENPNPYDGTVGTAVDLGLPSGTLWADHNIGATNPEDYGDYYSWGETATKETYDWSTYFDTNDGGQTFGKYNNDDGKTELETSDDVASQTWGGKWQMPTRAMIEELKSQCYWVWTTTYKGKSVSGYIVYKAKSDTDKGVKVYSDGTPSSDYDVATDPHIFLPAAGYRWGSELDYAGDYGYYWSRSLLPSYSYYAYGLGFNSGNVWDDGANSRYRGFAVRPVVLPAAE